MDSIERRTIWIRKTERVDGLTIKKDDKVKFFSYTYFVKDRGKWRPVVRWDNYDSQPHVDKFDENGGLLEQKPTMEKDLKEVVSLVTIFRRNLMAMDLGEL